MGEGAAAESIDFLCSGASTFHWPNPAGSQRAREPIFCSQLPGHRRGGVCGGGSAGANPIPNTGWLHLGSAQQAICMLVLPSAYT